MIPKIIHYTWFSNDPYTETIQKCIDSWHKYMPDWEFRLWDAKAIENIDNQFLREALSAKKWAFAADFVRLYAIYNYGGVYLDSDVLVVRDFSELTKLPAFIGRENSIHINGGSSHVYLSSHCFGAEKGNPYIGECLAYYNNRHFILSDNASLPNTLRLSMLILPYIMSELALPHGYNNKAVQRETQELSDIGLTIFPSEYFDFTKITRLSFCKHLAVGSWRDHLQFQGNYTWSYKIEWRVMKIIKWILSKFNYHLTKLQ